MLYINIYYKLKSVILIVILTYCLECLIHIYNNSYLKLNYNFIKKNYKNVLQCLTTQYIFCNFFYYFF